MSQLRHFKDRAETLALATSNPGQMKVSLYEETVMKAIKKIQDDFDKKQKMKKRARKKKPKPRSTFSFAHHLVGSSWWPDFLKTDHGAQGEEDADDDEDGDDTDANACTYTN